MEPAQYRRIKDVLGRALELHGSERIGFLEEECGEDESLRLKVAELLRSSDSATSSALGRALQEPLPGRTAAPTQIGPYRICKQLGAGGMGEVYLAEQEQPIQRQVALKLIRLGFESETVIQRFESKRQALAMMDHENIARAYDAGTTEDGRPYFVMEYVEGVPLTQYCNEKRLGTASRLELIAQVCDGLQHAHQKAIIHRDIKPSNILVREQDGRAIPKIIDFGVAKAAAQPLTQETLFTELGQLIGTPEYMSPEQADLAADNVDTRTDIYSVGVLMYEVLVGVLPYDPEELRKAGFDEILRRIREDDPPRPSTPQYAPVRPSTRLNSLGPRAQATLEARKTTAHRLSVQLRGELDWITMKALEKERGRRYGSASEMAQDLRRYLRHEPVSAGPPGAGYRLSKFVRRNRVSVAFSGLAVLFLAALAITSFVQARRIAKERDRASPEAESAREISDFLVGLFKDADPSRSRGPDVTAREILEAGAKRIETLDDQPLTQASFRETIGGVYGVIGLFDEGLELLEKAHEYREESATGDPHAELALAHSQSALSEILTRGGDADRGLPLAQSAVEIRERLLGSSPELAQSLSTLSNVLWKAGQRDEAEVVHRRALEMRRETLPAEHPAIASSLHNIASLRLIKRDFSAAEEMLSESIAIIEHANGPDDFRLGMTLHMLAKAYQTQGKNSEALPLEKRSLAIHEKALGPDHPHVGYSLTTLSRIYEALDDAVRGEPLARRAVETGMNSWGPDHPDVWWMQRAHASSLNALGRHEEALDIMEPLIERIQAAPRKMELAQQLAEWGKTLAKLGRLEEAAVAYRATIENHVNTGFLNSPNYIDSVHALAKILRDTDRDAEAHELESLLGTQ